MNDPRTMTGYNYAGGDPINQSDPSGCSSCSTNTGYWTPPGCASNPSGNAQPPIGGYAMQNGGGKRVFNDQGCVEAFVGTAVSYGTGKAAVAKTAATRLGKLAVRAAPYVGWAWTGFSVYQGCIA